MNIRLIILLVVLAVASLSSVKWVEAAEVQVSKAWLRASIGQSNVTAGYVVIENTGDEDDKLLGVKTSVADKSEVHRTSMSEAGVMRMRPAPELLIPAGETVEFKSGGDHIMLMGVRTPLKAGDFIDLTLTFERAGEVTVTTQVSRRNPFP